MATVLIVEDLDLQANLLQRYLSGSHTVVGRAETAEAAIELVRTESPDVALMDLSLKEGDGVSVTEEITSIDPSISIVVSTVTIDTETEAAARRAGADAYLTKPYDRDELLRTIEQVL
jgi:DNA-binding response OmpR family regulator